MNEQRKVATLFKVNPDHTFVFNVWMLNPNVTEAEVQEYAASKSVHFSGLETQEEWDWRVQCGREADRAERRNLQNEFYREAFYGNR